MLRQTEDALLRHSTAQRVEVECHRENQCAVADTGTEVPDDARRCGQWRYQEGGGNGKRYADSAHGYWGQFAAHGDPKHRGYRSDAALRRDEATDRPSQQS